MVFIGVENDSDKKIHFMVKYGVGFFDFDPIGLKIDFLRYQVTHNQNKFPYQIHHQEHDASVKKCP